MTNNPKLWSNVGLILKTTDNVLCPTDDACDHIDAGGGDDNVVNIDDFIESISWTMLLKKSFL